MTSGGMRERIKRAPVVAATAVGQRVPYKPVVSILAATLLLTAFFIGTSGFLSGGNAGLSSRVPYYVLLFAGAFVAGIYVLDDRTNEGRYVLAAVVGLSVLAFVLLSVAIEGVIYAGRNAGEVFGSAVLVYFVAAGLICIGVGIWGLRHWREFA